jgi:alkanesulfonate monooxygenase SsuD/methylene tetrahydromethanopterin reductase-like flavin-dependent oxidoreductase (luciferase family)
LISPSQPGTSAQVGSRQLIQGSPQEPTFKLGFLLASCYFAGAIATELLHDALKVNEHHRREFSDSAPAVILGAAAARTQRIRLTSAVTVLSAEDPVRAFQNFATLDLLSHGRAEMIVGRGSSIEAFPLFGFRFEDYDSLFAEKFDLLLTIREHEHLHWSGKHRAACAGQGKSVLC